MKRRRRRSAAGATNSTGGGVIQPGFTSDDGEEDILARNFGHMSPYVCREGLLARFEKLVNQLASGWKYHVSNTDGIKQAWFQFEEFYHNVCSYTSG
ncbi:hypothetical protein L596_002430 [Steinernema carpocapsae]|uniref:Uncharacterized protein n=1 Tax=Steinernema carpocapsae TaxID=34508 RepID=A0A4U8UPK8_STECR|nr:hypothetical protein L596_002430 [Steinernema carpocapsae]